MFNCRLIGYTIWLLSLWWLGFSYIRGRQFVLIFYLIFSIYIYIYIYSLDIEFMLMILSIYNRDKDHADKKLAPEDQSPGPEYRVIDEENSTPVDSSRN